MSGHILAMEKNDEDVAALTQALETPGHHLVSFTAYYDAIEYMEENNIDLIVCNIHLLNGSSFEFMRDCKSRKPDVPFLFYCIEPSEVTKPFLKSLAIAARMLGAADVIYMQRFDPGELCRQIEKHLPANIPRKCA